MIPTPNHGCGSIYKLPVTFVYSILLSGGAATGSLKGFIKYVPRFEAERQLPVTTVEVVVTPPLQSVWNVAQF